MKYTIIHINYRGIENMLQIKSILKEHEYVSDIKFHNTDTALAVLEKWGFTDKPKSNILRNFLPGEYGIWASSISVWEYIVQNNIEKLLVFEDDAILSIHANKILSIFCKELPDDWDFLSLCYDPTQNKFDKHTNINKNHIHKSSNQFACFVGMIYSLNGAKKILDIIKDETINDTVDNYIYDKSRENKLNGYSIIPGRLNLLKHNYSSLLSTIDPENKRILNHGN
jgi:GR25 family glycosyltransferase involved in LPS biosynthesis